MNVSLMNDGNIYFLDFIFNPKLRTLRCGDVTCQLRKKEADVLALLCDRFPDPVSQDDFLSCVWEGGYVTPQSIAQVIRSLRRNLQDKDKQIIVTIPKLGYRFGISPAYDEPATAEGETVYPSHIEPPVYTSLYDKNVCTAQYDAGCGRFAYNRASLINIAPLSVNSLAISPYERPKRRGFRARKFVFVVLFVFLIYLLWYCYKTHIIPFRTGADNEVTPTPHSNWASDQ